MKLRVNDTLVTIKPNKEGIEATIWAEFSYIVQFKDLKDFIENIEDQVELHNELNR